MSSEFTNNTELQCQINYYNELYNKLVNGEVYITLFDEVYLMTQINMPWMEIAGLNFIGNHSGKLTPVGIPTNSTSFGGSVVFISARYGHSREMVLPLVVTQQLNVLSKLTNTNNI